MSLCRFLFVTYHRVPPLIGIFPVTVSPPPVTAAPPGHCADSSQSLVGPYCYYFSRYKTATWPAANYMCQKLGMTLASIHSATDNSYIWNTFMNMVPTANETTSKLNTPDGVWLGMTKGIAGTYMTVVKKTSQCFITFISDLFISVDHFTIIAEFWFPPLLMKNGLGPNDHLKLWGHSCFIYLKDATVLLQTALCGMTRLQWTTWSPNEPLSV